MQSIIKQIIFIALFKLKTSNKNYIIQNESVYMYTKCHKNQSLFTQCSLHSLVVILTFTLVSYFFFELHYITKAVVCQHILKVTV
jgi:hypothetical protein